MKYFRLSDEEVLMEAQIIGRPLDPVIYREMERRYLLDRWMELERKG
jgi:hypothetical protein